MTVLVMVSFAWVCTAAPDAHRLTAHPAKLARIRETELINTKVRRIKS